MGLIGEQRSAVDPKRRRQSYLKLVYENGYHDGLYAEEKVREETYLEDEEALMRYRIGFRIGLKERRKMRHEA